MTELDEYRESTAGYRDMGGMAWDWEGVCADGAACSCEEFDEDNLPCIGDCTPLCWGDCYAEAY